MFLYKNFTSSINSIGYKELWLYLNNKIKFNDAKKKIIKSTLELSNKQLGWLKKWNNNIIYFDSNKSLIYSKIYKLIIKQFIKNNKRF